jgi:hypothetical protein
MMAIMVIRTCQLVEGGLPANVTLKMYLNIILDFVIGLVPVLGDIADAMFRANTRNAIILEEHLRESGTEKLRVQGGLISLSVPGDPYEHDWRIRRENGLAG